MFCLRAGVHNYDTRVLCAVKWQVFKCCFMVVLCVLLLKFPGCICVCCYRAGVYIPYHWFVVCAV